MFGIAFCSAVSNRVSCFTKGGISLDSLEIPLSIINGRSSAVSSANCLLAHSLAPPRLCCVFSVFALPKLGFNSASGPPLRILHGMGSRPEWISWLQDLEDRLSGQMMNVLRAIQQRQWSEAQITQFFVDARRFGDDFLLNALHNLVSSTPTAHQHERSRQHQDEEEAGEDSVDLELRLGRSRCRTSSASRLRKSDSQSAGRHYGADTLNLGLGTSDDCERHHESDLLVWFGA